MTRLGIKDVQENLQKIGSDTGLGTVDASTSSSSRNMISEGSNPPCPSTSGLQDRRGTIETVTFQTYTLTKWCLVSRYSKSYFVVALSVFVYVFVSIFVGYASQQQMEFV